MARIGNEAKLILKLAGEKARILKDSRLITVGPDYRNGYLRCSDDIWAIINQIVAEVEEK